MALSIPAKAEYLSVCRLALAGLSQTHPLEPETLADVKLALTEACSNSIRHAYREGRDGEVEIRYELDGDRLAVEVRDEGSGFSVDAAPGSVRRPGRGRARPRDHRVGDRRARDRVARERLPAAVRQVSRLTARLSSARLAASVRQRRSQGPRGLRLDRRARSHGRDRRRSPSRSRACASCISPRPRSAAAWPRSSTRSSRSCRTRGSTPSGTSSTARTSSSTSRRRSTTGSRVTRPRSPTSRRRSSAATRS